jgi:hypothetical protein
LEAEEVGLSMLNSLADGGVSGLRSGEEIGLYRAESLRKGSCSPVCEVVSMIQNGDLRGVCTRLGFYVHHITWIETPTQVNDNNAYMGFNSIQRNRQYYSRMVT